MIILSLIERIIFGCITAKINSCKGRDGGFAWGFFLCGIGIIVTATRASLIKEERHPLYTNPAVFLEKEKPAPQPPVQAAKTWKCVSCGHENALGSASCTECDEPRRYRWTCAGCGRKNEAGDKFCPDCGNAWSAEQEKSLCNAAPDESFIDELRALDSAAGIAAAFEEKFAGVDSEDVLLVIASLKKVSASERIYGNMRSLALQRAEAFFRHGMKVFPVDRSNPTVTCPVCGKVQRNDRECCFGCGALFKE